ncbi:NAD(P)H-dependent oxidoreductase subunit E [Christensenella tenuis]|jgi:NADH:ubiquinone oxidoreductase subunit E|uniref:NAD(P)H-dependent oxidoreductase subunit E n=1 Tax=Christensenella tenuis TaxID=2763033 RepID=A0ABR7EJX1_9FIRM|nr:NAD(P)H-dependent oxidoreductase subunit E [Christensenella tenuis]MBC5649453.1 NAD(P)H-dependent oxidoreductase subunit E [Christensenella tenuis]
MMTINICIGSACHLKGSYNVVSELQEMIEDNKLGDKVELTGVFCLGHCTDAVSVQIGDEIFSVNTDNVGDFFENQVLKKV